MQSQGPRFELTEVGGGVTVLPDLRGCLGRCVCTHNEQEMDIYFNFNLKTEKKMETDGNPVCTHTPGW